MRGYVSKWIGTHKIETCDGISTSFDFYNTNGRIFMWWSIAYEQITYVIDGWFVT